MERSIVSRRLQKAFVALTVLMLSSLLGSCTAEAPLSRDELTAIHDGRSAVILMRFVGKDQLGEPLKPFYKSEPLQVGIGDFESGGELRDATTVDLLHPSQYYRFFSKEAQTEGWIALIRPPGYYYLAFWAPRGFDQPPPHGTAQPPRWRIEVPAGTALVYVGTFHLTGTTEAPLCCGSERSFFTGIDQTATQIEDESDAAAQRARRDLPSLPPPLTRLAVLHTGPFLLGVPAPVQ